MNYHEITMRNKRNIDSHCIPFCVERESMVEKDFLHIHDFHQLTVITRGNATLVLNGISYPIRTGDVYVINSFSAHYLKEIRDLEFINVLFYLQDLEASCESLINSDGFRRLFYLQPIHEGQTRPGNIFSLDYMEAETVNRILEQMLKELETNLPGFDIMIQSGFLMLITYLTRICNHNIEHRPSMYALQLHQAVEYLETNFADPISISELSEVCNITERQLRNIFERVYGCTPLHYLWNIRIRKACFYLASTDLPIAEIAALTGFEDSNYFSRKFRQALGVTPRDYRSKSGCRSI